MRMGQDHFTPVDQSKTNTQLFGSMLDNKHFAAAPPLNCPQMRLTVIIEILLSILRNQ
jgi:hypothetical protein